VLQRDALLHQVHGESSAEPVRRNAFRARATLRAEFSVRPIAHCTLLRQIQRCNITVAISAPI